MTDKKTYNFSCTALLYSHGHVAKNGFLKDSNLHPMASMTSLDPWET